MVDRPFPRKADQFLTRPSTEFVISIVTAWEITLKPKLGHTPDDLERAIQEIGATLLPIKFAHLDALTRLPFYEHHKDPFDRILIAQALAERLPVVSSDMNFKEYKGLQVIWD